MCRIALSVLIAIVFNDSLPAQTSLRRPRTLAASSQSMQSYVDANQISGAVTLVAHKGKIVQLDAVGMADIEAGRRMEKDTLFAIASMTKPVVATALMILQDEGKLNVEDKVSKFIPQFAQASLGDGVANREITIRDAITHTSGLSGSQVFDTSLAEVALELAQRRLAFQPGTKWQYSPGLNVVGRIVEIVAEMPLDKFMATRIFQPLDMVDTTFFPTQLQRQRLAVIYEPSEDKKKLVATKNYIVDYDNTKAPNPSGGLVSSAADMAKFYQMVLDGGVGNGTRIVSANAVKQMTSPQTGDLTTGFTPGNCWGLGWCIVRQPQGVTGMLSPETFGHGGAFGTQGWVDPRQQVILVLMIQRTNFGNSDASSIRKDFQQLAVEALGR